MRRGIVWGVMAVLVLSIALAVPAALAEGAWDWWGDDTGYEEERYGRTNRAGISIREQDYSRAKIVAELPDKGTMVTILDTDEGSDGEEWHYVRAGGYEGFLQSKYVDEFRYEDIEAFYGQTNEDDVRLREKPQSRGKIVVALPERGTLVTVLSEDDGWYYVQVAEYEGYVQASYIDEMGDDSYEDYAAWYGYTNASGLNLRESAYSRGKIVVKLTDAGTLVTILDETEDSSGEDWYYAQVGRYEGYIEAYHIDETDESDYQHMLQAASSRSRSGSEDLARGYAWIVPNGERYHKNYGCSNMNGPWQVPVSEAEEYGLTPCGKCWWWD